MSLIERAIQQRKDDVPTPVLKVDPRPHLDDVDGFVADPFAPRGPAIVPPAQGNGHREPSMPSMRLPADLDGDDEWSRTSGAPLADDFDDPDRSGSSVRSKTVTIDLQRLREGGMIAPDGDKTPLAEEFRVIKRPLLKNAFGGGPAIRNGNLVMVTSAFPREGKSFCAINLAMSIAMERDRTVLLVDADVARPSIPQKFGIAPDVGLMDVLLDHDVKLSDAIVRTNVNKLALLPAGRPHRQATELLASEAMANLLAELSARYADRIVIFDSPPLLVTTEARTLAANMGQLVMVVESDNTTHEAVREALATIESCEVVGMVLNKGRRSNPGDSYGYYGY